MIKFKNIMTSVFVLFFASINGFAEKTLPPPKGSGGFSEDYVVGGSIDGVAVLFVLALILGVWFILTYNKELGKS